MMQQRATTYMLHFSLLSFSSLFSFFKTSHWPSVGSADSSGVKPAESNRAADGEEVLAEIPFNGFDDQPLAKWFEEIQAPTSIDGSSKLLTFH